MKRDLIYFEGVRRQELGLKNPEKDLVAKVSIINGCSWSFKTEDFLSTPCPIKQKGDKMVKWLILHFFFFF